MNAIQVRLRNSRYRSCTTAEKGTGTTHRIRFHVRGGQEDEALPRNVAGGRAETNLIRPTILHPVLRLGVFLISVGIILTLEIMLRRSQADDGLGDAGDQTYLHYSWTVVPAIVVSLLSLFFGMIDLQTRLLAPYASLIRGGRVESSVDLDLADGTPPFILWRELRTRCYAAAMTTTAALTSPLFAIFAGSLFTLQTLPSTSDTYLRTTGSFMVGSRGTERAKLTTPYQSIIISMVLENNFSYPAFTYENLAFPVFDLPSAAMENTTIRGSPSSVLINATVPALRPKLSCRQYDTSEINAVIYTNGSYAHGYVPLDGYWNVLQVDIPDERCPNTQKGISTDIAINLGPRPSTAGVFGYASASLMSCSGSLYAWGSYDFSTTPPSLSFVSAIGCNESLELVDVEVTFSGSDLEINPSYPPRPIESSARSTTAQVLQTPSGMYDFLVNTSSTPPVDRFFGILTTSPHAIPLSDLADGTRAQRVADAIRVQQGILATQWVNGVLRLPANETNATLVGPPTNVTEGNDARHYPATVTDPAGRSRVVQNPTSTRALEALLAAVLLFACAGWALMPRTAILPRRPSSIASVAAMLAGGNLLEFLPLGAEWMANSELRRVLPDSARFWIGWGDSVGGDEQFGIWVVDPRVCST